MEGSGPRSDDRPVAGVTTTRDGPGTMAEMTDRPAPTAAPDPRAVRIVVAASTRLDGDPTVTVAPPAVPVQPLAERLAGVAILGGVASPLRVPEAPLEGDGAARAGAVTAAAEPGGTAGAPLVNGAPVAVRLEWLDDERAVLVEGDGPEAIRTRVLLGPVRGPDREGIRGREIAIGGWRVELEIESERRAALRERARRGHETAGRTGPLEVRAIIPGRIVAVSVTPGDAVRAGQQVLVLEAMKMQNELRAPREGTVDSVAVGVGQNVEVGDLLLVIS